jgi:hypothetical protein
MGINSLQLFSSQIRSTFPPISNLSTSTGWMIKRAFFIWCYFLVFELSIYRHQLPPDLQEARFLLLLDGHASRACWEALTFLSKNGIDVLCFPSHSTHILQPFDLTVGGALKNEFGKTLLTNLHGMGENLAELISVPTSDNDLGIIRGAAMKAFLNSWSKEANFATIQGGFARAGLFPLNVDQPLKNPFVARSSSFLQNHSSISPRSKRYELGCKLLTSPDVLSEIKTIQDANEHAFTLQTEGSQKQCAELV